MKTFYIRDNSLFFKEKDGKLLILKKDKRAITELNEIGLMIWKLLESKKTIEFLVKKIMFEYETVSFEDVKKDVEEFLLQGIKNSIIKKLN